MVTKLLAATLVVAAAAWQYDPRCPRDAVGQHSIYIPGCSGTGCGAPYETGPDCAFCVYDMEACSNEYGADACQQTYNARKAEGFCGCDPCSTPSTPGITSPMQHLYYSPLQNTCIGGSAGSPAFTGQYTVNAAALACTNWQSSGPQPTQGDCTRSAVGQRSLYIPGCSGTGCGAPYETGPDCAFCVYDFQACANEYGADACQATYDARKAEGYCGCNSCSSYGSCAGFWYDSSIEPSYNQATGSNDLYYFYFYQDFVPVPNGQCNTGLKGNASLGASSPAAGRPVAIQNAYKIAPGSMLIGSDSDDTDYSGAANKCMQMGSGCTGFTFTCSSAPNGCGVCTAMDDQCTAKFPPAGTNIQYSTLQPAEEYLVDAGDQAAYTKVAQITVGPSPSPSNQCAVSNPSDCGYTGITKDQCLQNNCCWQEGGNQGLWCFHPNSAEVAAIVV